MLIDRAIKFPVILVIFDVAERILAVVIFILSDSRVPVVELNIVSIDLFETNLPIVPYSAFTVLAVRCETVRLFVKKVPILIEPFTVNVFITFKVFPGFVNLTSVFPTNNGPSVR